MGVLFSRSGPYAAIGRQGFAGAMTAIAEINDTAEQIGFKTDFGRSVMVADVDVLRDDQWERLKPLVPGGSKGKRGPRTDNRRFLNALLWMARSGGRWRDLPEPLGDYGSVKRRYYRWIEMGVLDAMFGSGHGVADDRDHH